MRAFAFISGVLSLGALVLSLLCLFAGNRPGFLDNGSILTIKISSAGKELLWNDTISGDSNITSEVGSMAAEAGISDWYAIHVLNYCRGSYANSTTAATESCSTSVPFFSFNPIQIISSQFKDSFNVSLGGLDADVNFSASGWPSQIKDSFGQAETAYKVVFFMLCMGIASSGVEAIVSLVAMIMYGGRLRHGTAISWINLAFGAVSGRNYGNR
jgi:hypothetical protein